MSVSPSIRYTAEQEAAARRACFEDCAAGAHLDFEAGCCSVCRSPAECQGWVPYLNKKEPSE